MSPEAVDQRLREVASLYKLGMSICKAKYLGTVEELKRQELAAEDRPHFSDNASGED